MTEETRSIINGLLDAAIAKLVSARQELSRDSFALCHADLTRAHVSLHECDSVLIMAMLRIPVTEPAKPLLPGAIR